MTVIAFKDTKRTVKNLPAKHTLGSDGFISEFQKELIILIYYK